MTRKILRKDFWDASKILELSTKISEEEIKQYQETKTVSIKLPRDEAEKRKKEIEAILAYRRGENMIVHGKNAKNMVEDTKRKKKLSNTVNSTVGERVKHHEGNKYGWIRNLKRGEVKFDKPVVLLLPGDGAEKDRDANGYVKTLIAAMGRIGVEENDIQILAAYYPVNRSDTISSRRYLDSRDESIDEKYKNPDYVKDIYNTIIRPVLFKNSKGEKQSIENIAKKLRNLTIISHCFGSFAQTILIENLVTDMKNLKFNSKEIETALGEIVNISISPRSGYHKNNKNVLTIGFSALNDGKSNYSYLGLLDSSYSEDVANSSMGIGLMEQADTNFYLYLCGDTYDYKYGKPIVFASGEMHGFRDYTDEDEDGIYYYEKDKNEIYSQATIQKNENGKNFSRLICRTVQNAVSLSSMGVKRTIDKIISNETPVVFRQGRYEDNEKTAPAIFDGGNEVFKKEYKRQIDKVYRMKELFLATEKLRKTNEKKKSKEDTSNISKVEETIKNQSKER